MKRTNTPQTFDISTLMVIPSEQETKSSYESSQATAPQELNDTLILVSNSVLDGFREGDGDLMDKIVIHLNRKGILAKRIVENSDKIPANKREQVSLGQLVALGDKTQCDNETLQNKLLDIIQQHTDKTIILYIGSRLDVVDMHQEQPMRAGSGSLYTKEFLQELQKGLPAPRYYTGRNQTHECFS
ncbi:MAG: hypothetical protein K0S11_31 [Gammaproteobacteria bacterium]|nr:hypothetical protein [Gammaproteobacteria bacterium]